MQKREKREKGVRIIYTLELKASGGEVPGFQYLKQANRMPTSKSKNAYIMVYAYLCPTVGFPTLDYAQMNVSRHFSFDSRLDMT